MRLPGEFGASPAGDPVGLVGAGELGGGRVDGGCRTLVGGRWVGGFGVGGKLDGLLIILFFFSDDCLPKMPFSRAISSTFFNCSSPMSSILRPAWSMNFKRTGSILSLLLTI